MSFNLIPVTRTPATGPRAKRTTPDVSIALNKHGDLTIILSEAFFAQQELLAVGSRVQLGYNSETKQLALVPATTTAVEATRMIRKRPSLEGAGTVFIKAVDLPASLPVPSDTKRIPLEWLSGDAGAAYLSMPC